MIMTMMMNDEDDNSTGNKDSTAMKSSKWCSTAFSFIIVKNIFLSAL